MNSLLPLTPLLRPASPESATAPRSRFFALRSWLRLMRLRRNRLTARLNRDLAAMEACASEGAEMEVRSVELDGRRFEALYRHGELICLMPDSSRS
ncbi:hypothetical protein [Sphaerotilus uruguayifluvii]|uniref:Uncharacterized protein n=1 Tax=Sphaerotilus uruguayifluvii TaxID=2735897 RepID=A0ABX2FWU8_9BURK|nr:hypothetical protein [Leptothrix sp. C29]NRT54437.1 hypothetical protein [Leptothrix sp. C29]